MKSVQTPSTVVVPAGRICPRCGTPLGGFGPEGLCGACLFDAGLATDEPAAELDLLSSGSRRFGDYELLEEIARGGMGVIFKARQLRLNRVVAVKMILRGEFASIGELSRFRAEAETAARLQHPNIVAIHEVGEREGQPFFSMDYVTGQNLAQLVGNTPLPATRAANYLKTIAEAVQYAHQQGVLHRDLKPSNVLIDANDQPRVTDFGLAKRFDTVAADVSRRTSSGEPQSQRGLTSAATRDLTITGQVLGSPNFMPPEQAAGKNAEIGPASDVYSLGAMLYHALTGRPPFVAESVTATLRLLAETEPVSPRLLVPTVPRDLETICLKCLQKEPWRRYATAQELAEDLNRFLSDEPIRARPASQAEKMWRWCRRKPALASAVALLLVVAIGSPVAVLRVNRARREAEAGQTTAKLEANKSQQVALFLKEMLRSAGPSVARGRDATILREILEKTAGRVDKDLPDEPEVRGDLWLALGNTYRDMGDFPRAISMLEKAVESYRVAFSNGHVKLALALGHLGTCQSFDRNVPVGKANATLGLTMARQCGDAETLAFCLMAMARSFDAWGMSTTESIPCLREAQGIWQQLGNNPVALADCLSRLAGCPGTDSAEAETLARDALALHRQHLEPNHPTVASDLFMLGQILVGRGEAEAAEEVLHETYDQYRQIYDPNHPHQPIVLRFLAESLLLQRKGDEAESLVRQQEEAAPMTAGHFDLLGRLIAFRGDWTAAVLPLSRAVELNPAYVDATSALAVALLQSGSHEEYRRLRNQYLELTSNSRNFEGNIEVAHVFLLLGGEDVDIERFCQFAELAISNVIKQDEFSVELVKALVEYRRGDYASAQELANRVLTREDTWLPRVAEGWFLQAMACASLQQFESARAALAKGDEMFNERRRNLKGDFLMQDAHWNLAGILGREARTFIERAATGNSGDPKVRD